MQRWERIARRVETETTPVRRFTKGEIAQRLKMSRPALNRRLNGKTEWEYDKLETLATLLGITVEELVANGGDAAFAISHEDNEHGGRSSRL